MTSYSSLIRHLLATTGRGGRTFEAFQRLDERLSYPHRAFQIVQVGGTNGKGSVATKIAAGLMADGKSVGLYTSPHISSFRERIRVNGEMISESSVVQHLSFLFSLVNEVVSFFDLLTALAFLYFREAKVDWAVVEVGIGGRLDATNVVLPDLAIITSISYDHMEILGNTLEKIAGEKKAIAKNNVPFIAGPHAAMFFPEAEAVLPVSGFYDAENSAIARTALRRLGVTEKAIEAGLKVRPAARFELVGNAVLDVAHNPDGFGRLIEALNLYFPDEKFHFILGFSRLKPWQICLNLIRPHAAEISFVDSHPKLIPFNGCSVEEALKKGGALRNVISGSFYLMAEARRCLGMIEPRDPD